MRRLAACSLLEKGLVVALLLETKATGSAAAALKVRGGGREYGVREAGSQRWQYSRR